MTKYFRSNGVDMFGRPCCIERVELIPGPVGPRGMRGPQGFPGERGDPGLPGADARLAAGVTSTGEPGTDAAVTERVENDVHYFDFVIPQGMPAPTSDLATAQLYKTSAEEIDAIGTLNFDIAQNFGNALVTQKDITVRNAGAYLINYGVSAEVTDNVVISLANKGTPITYSSRTLTAASPNTAACLIITLAAGDSLSLEITAINGTMTLSAGTLNAYLNLLPASGNK